MKGKKQRQKVIPHCYRRNLSRTLSNSSISQLVQLGSYKKRINDLSRNNRLLANSLQDARVEAAVQSNILQNCAKNCNNVLFARLKLNEVTKNISKLVNDLEEVRSYLNVDLTDLLNPFTHKKGSPSDRIVKEPAVNCIEEVTEEFSENEAVVSENVPAVLDPVIPKKSDVFPRKSGMNIDAINEDIVVAPILFADDSEEKVKKKSSSKSRSSKMCYDPDKGSLTPELNVDLTCLKLKRNSSRRQTQFKFPGSRSTSRGKNTPSGKENCPEELITPTKPASLPFTHQEQDAAGLEKQIEEIFKSPINNDVREEEPKNLNNYSENNPKLALDTNQCDFSTGNAAKNLKSVVQPFECNHTVHLCEDMELTEVIRPEHQIVLGVPPESKLDNSYLNCDNTKVTKENGAIDFSAKTKDNENVEIISEKVSLQLLNAHPDTSILHDENDIQLPEINEQDEIQNVGVLTFCEPNDDKNKASRATKSSLLRSRRSKPVKYCVFFSSDESDGSSPFESIPDKRKASKRKTVTSTEVVKSSKKNENTVSQHKASLKNENKILKDDLLKCTVDVLHSGKEERMLEEKLKYSKSNRKTDLPEQLPKKCTTSKDESSKHHKNVNAKKSSILFPGDILNKAQSALQTTEEKNNEKPLNKVVCNSNLDYSMQSEIETSESRRVSFAPSDLVCNFRKTSVSKKIAGNKKVRRTSKSVLDFEELLDNKAQTKTSHVGDHFSESTSNQQLNEPVLFNFSSDTELYTFHLPSSSHFSTIPTTDDLLMPKSNTSQKNVNKSSKHLKKVPPDSKLIKVKKNKDPKHAKPQHISDEIVKEKFNEKYGVLLESPVSICKPLKRKSLFQEDLDDNSKENIHFDHQILEKPKHISQENNKTHLNKNSEVLAENNCVRKSSGITCQNKVKGKVSTKEKLKLLEPTPETKKKKCSVAMKSRENSPVLKDTINLPDGISSRRRSRQVSYKEPSLTKKLRRE